MNLFPSQLDEDIEEDVLLGMDEEDEEEDEDRSWRRWCSPLEGMGGTTDTHMATAFVSNNDSSGKLLWWLDCALCNRLAAHNHHHCSAWLTCEGLFFLGLSIYIYEYKYWMKYELIMCIFGGRMFCGLTETKKCSKTTRGFSIKMTS